VPGLGQRIPELGQWPDLGQRMSDLGHLMPGIGQWVLALVFGIAYSWRYDIHWCGRAGFPAQGRWCKRDWCVRAGFIYGAMDSRGVIGGYDGFGALKHPSGDSGC
jgi:hypothetical protein